MAKIDDDAFSERAAEASRDALDRVRQGIKARITETGISMRKLARRAKVSPRTIQRFLAEPERDVHVGTVAAIAAVLLVDVQELFRPVGKPDGGNGGGDPGGGEPG